jgi:uncharacterized membrane protein
MADTTTLDPTPPASGAAAGTSAADLRTFTIIVYALYLAAFCSGFTALIGVILAYVKRADARGTPY